jgi:apolipoprotein D and lipocalin family protein
LPSGAYRLASAPLYSSAVLDRSRLVGRWSQVATFGPAQPGCKAGGVDIKGGANLTASFRLCLSGADSKGVGPLQPTGPGRFVIAGQEWWVLWADGDYRTLVIGTPSGRFGFVLNRAGGISADRMRAAREILEWNGYDLAQFRAL